MKNFIRFTSLCGAIFLFPTGNTTAQTSGQCAIAPTCSELGYEQKITDCNGQYMLKCPFDNSKVFCGGINCSYTNTGLPYGCADADSCIDSKGKIYYSSTCITCYTGYTLNNSGICTQTCTYTDTTSAPYGNKYSSCRRGSASGTKTYYKCTGPTCADGYYWYTAFGGDCQRCEYKSTHIDGRTSGPYTEEECKAACIYHIPFEYECSNKTWYGCKPKGNVTCF